jgi:hypothetical protein
LNLLNTSKGPSLSTPWQRSPQLFLHLRCRGNGLRSWLCGLHWQQTGRLTLGYRSLWRCKTRPGVGSWWTNRPGDALRWLASSFPWGRDPLIVLTWRSGT